MQSWRWHVILLQIMLLLVLLALLAVADCSWDDLTEDTHHYEGNYTTKAFKKTFKDGEIAPYKCQNGYTVSGLYSGPHVPNATCRGNKWEYDSRNLVCKAVSCGHPCPGGSCRNGAVNPPVFNFPNFVNFTCNPGYHLVTHDDQKWDPSYQVYCTSSGKWSRPAPKCVEVVCPQPTPIANGQVSPSKPIFRENDAIQYTCDQPYTLNGDATRRCQNDATWSGDEPVCEAPGATTCPRPGSIVNGAVDVPQGTLGVNAKIRYRCDAGYTLDGVAERVCQGDGSWSNSEPVCQAAQPSTTCSAPPPIANGAVDVPQGTLGVNSRVQYRCDAGYTLVGTAERVCLSDGSWSGAEPVCQAAVATTCPTPASITNGAVDVPPGTLGVNTKVRYQCNAGYMLVGVTERVCQMDGSWSGVEPHCQAIPAVTCPAPGAPTNGAVDVPAGMPGVDTRIQYRCNAGYTLVGMMERVCQADGSWSGAEPVCQATGQAPQPPQPPQPPQHPQPPAAPTTSQSPMPDAHPPGGDEKPSDSGSGEAQTTSWVVLSLLGGLVVVGAVVLYMCYLSRSGGDDDAGALMDRQGVETKSGAFP